MTARKDGNFILKHKLTNTMNIKTSKNSELLNSNVFPDNSGYASFCFEVQGVMFYYAKIERSYVVFERTTGIKVSFACSTKKRAIETAKSNVERNIRVLASSVSQFPQLNF